MTILAALVFCAQQDLIGFAKIYWPSPPWAGRVLLVPFIAMYSRVKKHEVLHNPTREAILKFVRSRPEGCSMPELIIAFIESVPKGTLAYHVKMLVANEFLVERRPSLRKIIYFAAGKTAERKFPIAGAKEVLDAIDKAPAGIWPEAFAIESGKGVKSIVKTLKDLEVRGDITTRRDGRRVLYVRTTGTDGSNEDPQTAEAAHAS